MRIRHITLISIILFGFLMSCSTGSKMTSVRQTADQACVNGNYAAALTGYEQIIAQYKTEGRTSECPVYGKAGLAAMKTGDLTKAIEYLEMDTYTPYATAETYRGLAKAYRQIDNLSKEIMALKDYIEKFPQGEHIDEIRTRLFETYVESENWQFATDIWPLLSEDQKSNARMLGMWFKVNQELENKQETDKLADELLKLEPDNVPALEYKAEEAYHNAEDHYQREMKAYENNRTNRQYKHLLEELDKVTAEFKVALGYFEKLWKIDQKPRYARYMSNIYVRFNDKEKADYYREKSGD